MFAASVPVAKKCSISFGSALQNQMPLAIIDANALYDEGKEPLSLEAPFSKKA